MKTYVHDMDVREEGREEGRMNTLQILLDLYQEGMITLDVIKEKTGQSDAQIEKALADRIL